MGDCSADLHLDVDLVGHLDPHDAPHNPLPGVHLDEALVHPHLEPVPGVAAVPARGLPGGDYLFEYPVEEEESISETAQSDDELEISSPETKEDDIKLKLLLQDYITHEIDELVSEVSQNLEKLKNNPKDKNVQKPVLDSIKVIKDLGQIHRYPAIEVSSQKVLENLDSFFKEENVLSSISIATLNELLNEFNNYIDLFLKGKEEEGNESIGKMNIIFLDTIAPPPKVEEKYSMKDGNEVQDFFTDINQRFI